MGRKQMDKPNHGEGDLNTSDNRSDWQDRNVSESAKQLLERDASVFLHQSVSTPCLTAISKAEGIFIEDVDGKRYMDFHGNNVHHIGYQHPRLVDALKRQLDTLSFAPRRFTCDETVELGELLASISPGELGKTLLAPSGNDAFEMAVSYARAVTGRYKTISFWDSYHGAGLAARSIGGEAMFRSGPIGPLMAGAEHVPPFGDYRNAWGVESGSADLCLKQIEYILEKEQDVAAVIAEPTRAVPYIPPPGFWKKVQAACRKFGTLLLFDEIPTCLGKTGRMFSSEWEDVVPDILVMGKSLGGGILPVAAMITHPQFDVLQNFAYGHYTHEKNPVTCRAAIETIRIIQDDNLVENALNVGGLALNRLKEFQSQCESIGDVRGRGCLIGIELVSDRGKRTPDCDLADRVLYRCLSSGLSFKVTMGNVLTLTPPLIISESQMHQALDILTEALATETMK